MSAPATNNDGTVAIDREYHWIPIDENTPRGCKLQLICKRSNVATYGVVFSDDTYWTHWAPLPTFKKEQTK